MALTRKFLSALGIEEEKAEQIIAAHTETVDGLKAERDKYKEDAEKLPATQNELAEGSRRRSIQGKAREIAEGIRRLQG